MSLDMDHRQWRDHEDRIRRLEETMTTDEQPSAGVVAQSMQEAILAVCRERLTAAGFAIVSTSAGADTVTISRKELDEAVHWFLPSSAQANAIVADIITRATRGGTQ